MKVLMRSKAIFLIVIICCFLFSSCKKDEEDPVSISGTVWKSSMVDFEIKEFHFEDEGNVEYKVTYYRNRIPFGIVEYGARNFNYTYNYSYPITSVP